MLSGHLGGVLRASTWVSPMLTTIQVGLRDAFRGRCTPFLTDYRYRIYGKVQ
jgi:hypothetical protein